MGFCRLEYQGPDNQVRQPQQTNPGGVCGDQAGKLSEVMMAAGLGDTHSFIHLCINATNIDGAPTDVGTGV